jgi:alanine racemase
VGDRGSGRPTWAEIDLASLEHNLGVLRAAAPGQRVIAVVKANGYGHGALLVAPALVSAGCEALAVATVAEGAELRRSGISVPVLLLQGLHAADEADFALEQALVPVLGSGEALEPLEAAGERAGRAVPVQLEFDTGMTRLGFPADDVDALLERVLASPRLRVEGVMSHLACADDPGAPQTAGQRERFAALVARCRERGLDPEWIHLDNSPAVLHGASDGTSAIRPGLALYGADPTGDRAGSGLRPVMTLRTRVLQVRDVAAGTAVGYGASFVAQAATRVATLPIGYADGLPRRAAGRFSLGLGGRRVPLAGCVSMDLASIDVGAEPAVAAGADVLVFGRLRELTIPVEELAQAAGTIAYEILVGIGARVLRVAVRRAD